MMDPGEMVEVVLVVVVVQEVSSDDVDEVVLRDRVGEIV